MVADRVYEILPTYYLLVLLAPLDQRHRYLMSEGRLPILLPGCETDEEAIELARELVERGHLDD